MYLQNMKRGKEQISREILDEMDNTTVEENVVVVSLDDTDEVEEVPIIEMPTTTTVTNSINSK